MKTYTVNYDNLDGEKRNEIAEEALAAGHIEISSPAPVFAPGQPKTNLKVAFNRENDNWIITSNDKAYEMELAKRNDRSRYVYPDDLDKDIVKKVLREMAEDTEDDLTVNI